MLRTLLVDLVLVVGALLAVSLPLIVGRRRLAGLVADWRSRLAESGRYLLALGVLLGCNSVLRDVSVEFSLFLGMNITSAIEAIEGGLVVAVQSFQTELLTTYFSYVYMYGYVYLLVFPLIAYLALEKQRPFRTFVVAYGLNYLLGSALYIAFIAFGPRNVGLAEGLLYATFPEFQFLTSEINNPTNVFPSLHTSLSATVAIFAYKTRTVYPAWLPIAVGLALSVIVSTMYLGIHWATDVVAGVVLAAVCVAAAERYVARREAADADDDGPAGVAETTGPTKTTAATETVETAGATAGAEPRDD